MKKLKNIAIVCSMVCIGLFLILVFAWIFNIEAVYHLMPARSVSGLLLYDHIEYNGEDYYYAEHDMIPDGVIPDFSEEIEVVIADSKCDPYGNDKTFEAYFCENDDGHSYIYYDSAHFVNDIDLAVKEMYEQGE